MPEKKKNHYLPKMLLKHWVSHDGKRKGIYTMDSERGKVYFSEIKGTGGYNFASKDNLYIPNIDGSRRLELENWLTGLESTLDRIVIKLQSVKSDGLFSSFEEMNKFLLSIVSLQHRTRYVIEQNLNYLNENKNSRKLLHESKGKEDKQLILENIVNASTATAAKFRQFELLVCKSKDKSLIFGDMPYLSDIVDGFSFVPLTNKLFVSIRAITENSFYKFVDVENDVVESLNYAIASNSVNWIVADNLVQLEELEEVFNSNIKVKSKYVKNELNVYGSTFKRKNST